MDVPLLDSLDGHVALVTGANRGIGKAIAQGLVDLGAHVYAGVRDPDAYKAPAGHTPLRLDVTNDASVTAAVDRIAEDHGRIDVLVNNAGIAEGWDSDLMSLPMEMADRVLETNLRGPFLLTKTALPLLFEADHARVVNVSSGMGAMGEGQSGHAPAYRVSKAGLNCLTVYLDAEYGDRGLIANVLCPGWVHTEMGGTRAPKAPEEGADTALWLARFAPGAPGGTWYRDRRPIDW